MIKHLIWFGLFLTLLGCSTTAEIQRSWITPDIENKRDLSGTLVVAITENADMRTLFEDEYVAKLQQKGVRVIASHTLGKDHLKAEEIIAHANEQQLDTILVTNYVGADEWEMYHPSTVYYGINVVYGDFNGYYGQIYEVGRTASYYTRHKYLMLVSTLYEVSTKERIWSAVSSAQQGGNPRNLFVPFIHSFVEQLHKDGLVK